MLDQPPKIPSLGLANSTANCDRGALLFVGGVWGLTLLCATVWVYHGGRTFPYSDEWVVMVGAISGKRSVTPSWLWEQYNEHRLVIPKLIYLCAVKLTNDFRAPIFLNVGILGGLALILILTVRKLRGLTSFADSFFPLVLLPWAGHSLWWGIFVQFTLNILLIGVCLALIVTNCGRLTVGKAALAGSCMLALPLCGGIGLTMAPFLALWLAGAAILQWREPLPQGKAAGLLSFTIVGLVLALSAFYFVGYHNVPWHPPSPNIQATIKSGLVMMAANFGNLANRTFWPLSALVVPALVLVSAAGLATAWRKPTPDVSRKLGLSLFLLGATCMCLVIGWGRAGLTTYILPDVCCNHYGLLPVPILTGVFLISELYGSPQGKRVMQMTLFAIGCMTFALQAPEGQGKKLNEQGQAISCDLREGITPTALTRKHILAFWFCDTPETQQLVELGLRRLRDARIGEFEQLLPDDYVTQTADPGNGLTLQAH